MAGSTRSTTGPVTVGPTPPASVDPYLPPIVRDYAPPIVNTFLPEPSVLDRVAAPPAPRNISITAAKRGDPEPYCFGWCIAKPLLIAADDVGDVLLLDLLWSVGECDRVEGFIVDDTFEGRAEQSFRNQHFEGTSSQTVSTLMQTAKGSYDTLANKCHSVLSWRTGFSLQIRGQIRGLKLIDPRTSPQLRYSTNPALALARIMTDLGYTMNWASVGTAADYCDEIIGSSSPQEKRWEIGGQIFARTSSADIIKTMSEYANCYVDLIGDEVYLIPDEPRAANHTVTQDDMLTGSVRVVQTGGRNVPASVTVHGTGVEYTPIPTGPLDGRQLVGISYTYGTPGGSGTNSDIQMPMFQTVGQCGRKAEQIWRQAQHGWHLEFTGFDNGIQRTIGDVGTITNLDYGINAQTMTLVENEAVGRGRWRRKYVPYSAADYSDVVYSETWNQTTLQNPHVPPAGPTPTVQEIVDTDLSGNQFSRIMVTWDASDWAYIWGYRVLVETTEAGDFDPIIAEHEVKHDGSTSYTIFTDAARVGTEYDVNVSLISNTMHKGGDPGQTSITPVFQPDPNILWDSTPIYCSALVPEDGAGHPGAYADIYFTPYANFADGSTGGEYYGHQNLLTQHKVIASEITATGQYLVKWEPVETISGSAKITIDAVEDMEGVWYDLYNDIVIGFGDETGNEVAEHQIVDITVAKDSGDGTPVDGTQRTKRVTFYADRLEGDYLVSDNFVGTNGTVLTSHTPEVDDVGTGWVHHAGGFDIQGNDLEATATDSRAVIDSGTADVAITALVSYGSISVSPITTSNLGLIGRAQDSSNYWLFLVDSAATTSPVIKLMLYTAGTPTIKAQKTLTGLGPLDNTALQAIRLEFSGNSITGSVTAGYDWALHEISCTSSSLNTATLHGIYAARDNITDNFASFWIHRMGDFVTTAKHFGSGASPTNYYKIGSAAGASPKVWTGGLIPATGSGDTWQKMTLVFCVYPVAHDNDKTLIFSSNNGNFNVGTNNSSGGLWLSGRNASTNAVQSVTVTGGLAAGEWHSVMISATNLTGPSRIEADIWVDGVEVYSGNWNTAGTTFNPMDHTGPCYVGAGDFPSGTSSPSHDPDFWEGLNCYLSFVWCKEQYLDPATYWDSFFDSENKPKYVGYTGAAVTGTAPQSYFPDADFTTNRGTGSNWTEVGTVPAAPSSPTD